MTTRAAGSSDGREYEGAGGVRGGGGLKGRRWGRAEGSAVAGAKARRGGGRRGGDGGSEEIFGSGGQQEEEERRVRGGRGRACGVCGLKS